MFRKKSIAARLTCVLLVALLCFFALAACEDDGWTSSDSGTASGQTASGGDTASPEDNFLYKDFYEDTTVKILCVGTSRHTYGELQFVPDEDSNYTKVSAAVEARNGLIEQNHGLKIEIYTDADNTPVAYLREQQQAGTADFDLVCDSVDNMVQSITDHLFWSIEPEKLSIDQPWWDRECMDAISIAGKSYFLSGDALITDDDNIYLYLYNKKMYEENADLLQYGDIYDIVKDGKFTLDLFEEMCKLVSHADENGEWGFNATYGNLSHAYGATVLVNGCDFAMATTDPDTEDYFQLNVDSGQGQTIFDKVYQIMSDKQITQRAELIIGQGSSPSKYGFAELEEMFVNQRGLFYNTTSSSISILKRTDMDFEFGVLPTPKYDESQERYCNTVNRYQSSVIGIPICCRNMDAAYALLDALGYYGGDVKKAYYQETLQLQTLSEEDSEMLDLVYGSRFYDLGSYFNWGNGALINFYGSLINGTTNDLASRWEAIESSVETDMHATVEAYKDSVA